MYTIENFIISSTASSFDALTCKIHYLKKYHLIDNFPVEQLFSQNPTIPLLIFKKLSTKTITTKIKYKQTKPNQLKNLLKRLINVNLYLYVTIVTQIKKNKYNTFGPHQNYKFLKRLTPYKLQLPPLLFSTQASFKYPTIIST